MKKFYSIFIDLPWYVLMVPFIFILNELRFVFFEYISTTTYNKIVFISIIFFSDLIIFVICKLFIKNKIKAGILSILPLLFFNHYFVIFNYFLKFEIVLEIFNSIHTKIHWFILLILAILETGIFLLIRKTKISFRYFNFYLNIIFIIFLFIEVYKYMSINQYHIQFVNNDINEKKVDLKKPEQGFPDIYFIIYDSYNNYHSLKKYWGYDNSYLKNYLVSMGFWFSEKSQCNYNQTEYSVSSTINSSYLDIPNLDEKIKRINKIELIDLIRNNKIIRVLKKYKYNFKEFSLFKHKNISYFNYFDVENLFYRTFIYLMQEKIFGVSKPDYLKTNDIKNSIFKTNKENNPFFVYVHFPIPHYPYFFDSNGNKITDLNKNFNRTNKFYYLSQLKYTNSVIKEVTENIIKHDKNSIIIIQGDHGFRFLTSEMASDIDDEGFSILNAIYLPDSNYVGFPDTMNAINTFRYIFNNYFDTKLKILENKRTYILDSHEIINKTQIY